MTDNHECGHTPEEHEDMFKDEQAEIIMEVLKGNFTGLFPGLDTMALHRNMEGLWMEMYFRSPNDEEFEKYIVSITEDLRNILLPAEGEESSDPEVYQFATEMKAKLQAKQAERADATAFELEAADELRVLFEQHGVADDATSTKKAKDDDFPGFYL
jgi:hypothetical protein